MAVRVSRRRFTVDEYHRMLEGGILAEDDRVELIEGEIVEMTPIGPRHAACVDRLNGLLTLRTAGRAIVRVQSPIQLGGHSEPQPDVTVLRPRTDFYAAGHPGPEDVLLLVEVVETSAEYDRQVKLPLYARSGIREVWVVDLAVGTIEAYREAAPDGYRQVRRFGRGETLSPEALPDAALGVDDILGPPPAGD
jgi:Uma2 family endonuclease